MFNPQLYSNHNILQSTHNLRYLQEYNQTVNWKIYSSSVLDIGSGDGDFTSNVLVDFLQPNFTELIGCDENEDMVQFANQNYRKDRVSFEVCNIEKRIPTKFYNHFTQIFSFFAFNWIQNQNKAFSNTYDLLAPGGGCFLIFLGSAPFYKIYRTISKMPRWKPYTKTVEDIVSPYHDFPDQEAKVTGIMKEAGFIDIFVKSINSSHRYESKDDFKAGQAAVNTFAIPKNDFEDYLDDLVKVGYGNGHVSENHVVEFTVIVAHARKSKNIEEIHGQ